MKKYLLLLPLAILALMTTACSYDDDDLWNAVDDITDRVDRLEAASAQMTSDIAALQTLVNAMQQNISITSIAPTENGYKITFSDGQEATITNGIDGAAAPQISIKKDDSDGLYYWTIDGEWMIVDGERIRATALDGNDAIAPQVRINSTTGEWEISTDGGQVWTSTGISAKGDSGDSLFKNVDTSNPDYVIFTLTDGTELRLQRYDANSPLFAIKDMQGVQVIRNGQSHTYDVETANIASYTIQKPDGWRVKFESGKLTITAPVAENTYAEQDGTVAIVVISPAGTSMIVKIAVATYETRILTFEDADAKFDPFTLGYCDKTISTWSDLIDSKQYGGTLLYGPSQYGMEEPYYWYDQNNTELMHIMPEAYGSYCYWGGGHAVSNYHDLTLDNASFMNQLSVYATSGHNGSANFAMHYGYGATDNYSADDILPSIEFYDGSEHVIDHMWVCPSTYLMNCMLNGNGLTDKIGPNDNVRLIAIGFNSDGTKTGEAEIFIANGSNNIMTDWTKWDLSSLGKVSKVLFNMTGSSDNGHGFSQPAYFAYDDVAVIF